MTALATATTGSGTASGWPGWCRASVSGPSCTAWPPSWTWPATSATTPQASSSRWRARRRRGAFRAPPGGRGAAAGPDRRGGSTAVVDPSASAGSGSSRADRAAAARTFVSPDVAVCDDCLAELFDPADRRYRYPFINCTNCGPRFTITVRLPYDRPNTTMGGFALCAGLRRASTTTRPTGASTPSRWPAPPAGPRIWFEPAGRRAVEGTDAAIAATQAALAAGAGRGRQGAGRLPPGVRRHLGRGRGRVARPQGPAGQAVRGDGARPRRGPRSGRRVDADEAALLAGPARPIVLLRPAAPAARCAELVAPGNPYLGRAAALHAAAPPAVPARAGVGCPVPRVLVMTSGNLTDEPICYDDDDARAPPGPHRRRVAGARPAHPRALRRLRGARSRPVRSCRSGGPGATRRCPSACRSKRRPSLAAGGELKNTFCLAVGPRRLDEPAHRRHGQRRDPGRLRAIRPGSSTRCTGSSPRSVAADAHPGYQTRRWAERRSGPAGGAGPAPPRPHRGGHGRARRARGRAGHRLRLRRHRLRHRRGHLGRRGARGRLRRASNGPPTCATCLCPAATPPSASPTGPPWPTCGPPASTGPRSPAGPAPRRPPSWPCCAASSNGASNACPRRAWAACSTP